jgi:hypothetical protein
VPPPRYRRAPWAYAGRALRRRSAGSGRRGGVLERSSPVDDRGAGWHGRQGKGYVRNLAYRKYADRRRNDVATGCGLTKLRTDACGVHRAAGRVWLRRVLFIRPRPCSSCGARCSDCWRFPNGSPENHSIASSRMLEG